MSLGVKREIKTHGINLYIGQVTINNIEMCVTISWVNVTQVAITVYDTCKNNYFKQKNTNHRNTICCALVYKTSQHIIYMYIFIYMRIFNIRTRICY